MLQKGSGLMAMIIALALALLVGLSLGVLGGGGSILTLPILRYVLGIEGHSAIALSLLVVAVTSAFALIPHARAGRIQWRTGLVFGASGMLGAFAAGRLAPLIAAPLLLLGFAGTMFGTALAMMRPPRRMGSATIGSTRPNRSRPLPLVKVLLEGLAVGVLTGLVGAGGGFLVIPALVLLGKLPMNVAVGTSLLVITLKSFAGFLGFIDSVSVDWGLGAAISAAAVGGSLAGSSLVSQLSPEALREGFAWFVVAMAFFVLAQELPVLFGRGAHPALAAVFALATTALAFALLGKRLRQRPARARVFRDA